MKKNTLNNNLIQELVMVWMTNVEIMKLYLALRFPDSPNSGGIGLQILRNRQKWRPCLSCQNYYFIRRDHEEEGRNYYRDLQEQFAWYHWTYHYYGISAWGFDILYIICKSTCLCLPSNRRPMPKFFFSSRFFQVNLDIPYKPEGSPYMINLCEFERSRESNHVEDYPTGQLLTN